MHHKENYSIESKCLVVEGEDTSLSDVSHRNFADEIIRDDWFCIEIFEMFGFGSSKFKAKARIYIIKKRGPYFGLNLHRKKVYPESLRKLFFYYIAD